MATMIATTTETTIRILNRFRTRGIIALGPHSIDLKNMAALEALAR
jgi:hypothetical protein